MGEQSGWALGMEVADTVADTMVTMSRWIDGRLTVVHEGTYEHLLGVVSQWPPSEDKSRVWAALVRLRYDIESCLGQKRERSIRLRVAPSNPARVTALLNRLGSELAWGGKADEAFSRARDSHMLNPNRWERGARLLLHWYGWAHGAWGGVQHYAAHCCVDVYRSRWSRSFGGCCEVPPLEVFAQQFDEDSHA